MIAPHPLQFFGSSLILMHDDEQNVRRLNSIKLSSRPLYRFLIMVAPHDLHTLDFSLILLMAKCPRGPPYFPVEHRCDTVNHALLLIGITK